MMNSENLSQIAENQNPTKKPADFAWIPLAKYPPSSRRIHCSATKMKTTISICLNIILVVIMVYMYVSHQVIDSYYKGYVGMVLNKSACQIQAGNSKLVQKVLAEVRYRPSYQEIASTLQKLNANETASQVGADQPATAPELKPEGKEKPQPESEAAPR